MYNTIGKVVDNVEVRCAPTTNIAHILDFPNKCDMNVGITLINKVCLKSEGKSAIIVGLIDRCMHDLTGCTEYTILNACLSKEGQLFDISYILLLFLLSFLLLLRF